MIKICYIPTLNTPICLWRIENYANELLKFQDKCRVYVDYFYSPDDNIAWDRVCLMDTDDAKVIRERLDAAFQHFDIIVFQKIQYAPGIELFTNLRNKYPKTKCLIDIDDAVGDIPPSHYYIDMMKNEQSYAAYHIQKSDYVISSTKYLADSIGQLNKNTYVLPNCINEDLWKIDPIEREEKNKRRLVYVAGGGHDEDLKIAYRAIKPLLDELPIELFVRYGGFRPDFLEEHKNINFKSVSWHISNYPQKLYNLNADIFLAPLRDTEFNRCKSNLKWIEAAYLNVPLIASNVEPYKLTKENGCKITLCENDKDSWYNNLKDSVFNCYKLKDECLAKYNINKEAEKLIDFYNSI